MKYLVLLIVANILISSGCKKRNDDIDGSYYGDGSVLQNGNLINFNKLRSAYFGTSLDTAYVTLEKWDGLVLKRLLSFGPFSLSNPNPQRLHRRHSGTSKLASNYSTTQDDGDVLCDLYDVNDLDSLQNFVLITSFDLQTKEIRGTFQASYVRDTSKPKCIKGDPDTLIIRGGSFFTKVQQ